MDLEQRRRQWRANNALELDDVRKPDLAPDVEGAVALYIVTIAELARRAQNPHELLERYTNEVPAPSLRALWLMRTGEQA